MCITVSGTIASRPPDLPTRNFIAKFSLSGGYDVCIKGKADQEVPAFSGEVSFIYSGHFISGECKFSGGLGAGGIAMLFDDGSVIAGCVKWGPSVTQQFTGSVSCEDCNA